MMEATREKSDTLTEHKKVPIEEAGVENIGTLKDRHGGQLLVVWLSGLMKERTKMGLGSNWPLPEDG
jgi:hypothetical protein